MKYKNGDEVKFKIGSPVENRYGPEHKGEYGPFGIGTITALLEEQKAYQVLCYGGDGKKYSVIVPESDIVGEADFRG